FVCPPPEPVPCLLFDEASTPDDATLLAQRTVHGQWCGATSQATLMRSLVWPEPGLAEKGGFAPARAERAPGPSPDPPEGCPESTKRAARDCRSMPAGNRRSNHCQWQAGAPAK